MPASLTTRCLLAAAVVTALVACGSGNTAPATATTTASPISAPPPPAAEQTTTSKSAITKGVITVPNAVGIDYQSAQDRWRAAGLHVAPAIDATGTHRLAVIDSNWVVLAQEPRAGAKVEARSFITATIKKYTDE